MITFEDIYTELQQSTVENKTYASFPSFYLQLKTIEHTHETRTQIASDRNYPTASFVGLHGT